MAPTQEIFPGGSWERPWTAGEDGDELTVEYEAGGTYVTVEGKGEIAIELDSSARDPIKVESSGLSTLAEHPRHESHSIVLRPSPGLNIWSIGFSAGLPPP